MPTSRAPVWSGIQPIAIWVFLRASTIGSQAFPGDPGLRQASVCAHYLLVGALPDGTGFDEALWTVVFPDHALGRLFDRWRQVNLIATMREAHRNLLKARMAEVMPDFSYRDRTREFYLPAGRGVFPVPADGSADARPSGTGSKMCLFLRGHGLMTSTFATASCRLRSTRLMARRRWATASCCRYRCAGLPRSSRTVE